MSTVMEPKLAGIGGFVVGLALVLGRPALLTIVRRLTGLMQDDEHLSHVAIGVVVLCIIVILVLRCAMPQKSDAEKVAAVLAAKQAAEKAHADAIAAHRQHVWAEKQRELALKAQDEDKLQHKKRLDTETKALQLAHAEAEKKEKELIREAQKKAALATKEADKAHAIAEQKREDAEAAAKAAAEKAEADAAAKAHAAAVERAAAAKKLREEEAARTEAAAQEAMKAKEAGKAAEAARLAAIEKAAAEAKAKAEAARAKAEEAELARAKASLDRPTAKSDAKAQLGVAASPQVHEKLKAGHSAAIAPRSKEQETKDMSVAHQGEMGIRLKLAGAKVGGLTCSLMWDNANDLDLHCESPTGSHIYYGARTGTCTGLLDVDANASEKKATTKPVENILWHTPPKGHYRIWVEKYGCDLTTQKAFHLNFQALQSDTCCVNAGQLRWLPCQRSDPV